MQSLLSAAWPLAITAQGLPDQVASLQMIELGKRKYHALEQLLTLPYIPTFPLDIG